MKVAWTSPSNIALVKYWGKHGVQLPQNPSVSFTLKESVTTLSIEADTKDASGISILFLFEGKQNPKFQAKIEAFLKTQTERFPWLLHYDLKIESSNTFPHSSGIASSASSMSALCLSLMSLDELITNKNLSKDDFFSIASELSRLASGSASRSVFGGSVLWGEVPSIQKSSDRYAIKAHEVHEIFSDYCDSILIVDDGEKNVSSRAGHALMENHPFKEQRFKVAKENLLRVMDALKSGDLSEFCEVVEEEALMLHSLMMTSRPSYILLKPQSLWLIDQIKAYREQKKIPVCFTIDAGPNIHLLYPKTHESVVRTWIESELALHLVGKKWIHDCVGAGPKQLEVVQ